MRNNEIVYFVIDGTRTKIKIGRTGDICSRICTLRTQYKDDLLVCGVFQNLSHRQSIMLETALHKKFNGYRIVNEWFEREPVERYIYSQQDKIRYPEPPHGCNFLYDLKTDNIRLGTYYTDAYLNYVVERNTILL